MATEHETLKQFRRLIVSQPPDSLTKFDLLTFRAALVTSLDALVGIAAATNSKEETMSATLTPPAGDVCFDEFEQQLNSEYVKSYRAFAILLAEGRSSEVDRSQMAIVMTGCGKTAGDLRRDVEQLQARIQANADELKASEIESELPTLKAAADDTFAKAKAEEASHRERMIPLREANQKADAAYKARRTLPAELRNGAHRIYGKTMSPENRREFERVSDTATRSHNLWRQLEDQRRSRVNATETTAQSVETLKLRLEALRERPIDHLGVADAIERFEGELRQAEAEYAEAIAKVTEIDAAGKAAAEAKAAFEAFQAGPMRDWRQKNWD